MGQKIHPFGFRVGITKKHQSVWFARFQKHQYAQSVLEDTFLRKNVSKILTELFEKKFKNSENMPKISHIQIVRGLIPYEIGIQIHAQNCQVLKTAFENFDVQPEILHNLLKNHVLLEKTVQKGKLPSFANETALSANTKTSENQISNNSNGGDSSNLEKKPSLSGKKMVGNKKKAFASFRQRFLGKFVVLKNKNRIFKKYDPNARVVFKNNLRTFLKKNSQEKRNSRFSRNTNQTRGTFMASQKNKNPLRGKMQSSSNFRSGKNFLRGSENKQKALFDFVQSRSQKSNSSRLCTKFVNFYMSQTNLSFLNAFKAEMLYWNTVYQKSKNSQIEKFGTFHYAPFGSQKKWSFERFERFEKLSLPVLTKLFKSLQQRAFQKMERLRKEYLVFGKFSKTKTFSYYQRIRFLQNFKKYIALRKTNGSFTSRGKEPTSLERQKFASKVAASTEKAIQKKYKNFSSSELGTEKNTIKFLDSLQGMVQQHRSKNLFLYLSTISDARKHLRKIQNFTKQQADFLFGVSLKNIQNLSVQEQRQVVKNQVTKTFLNISQKNVYQQGADQTKNYHDVFVEQLQKQRKIYSQNTQLMPKISLQFYSVTPQNFKTRASAVADSIVDDLEKRKAFRRVIKKAKEDLMKTSKVKGVKIQVSGRLNGAEIARSEWVRAGRVPLQTLRANIDYCYKTAQTMYGIIGVKVWIYKGYTKMCKPTANAPSLFSDLL
uniref:ribosomal protein S3 n=1 Tax=Desmodesmus abundans TaxID=77547 RepID=UPI0021CC8DB2|nr:ribosomal protein S3 [Desmodesmus abundans]UWJ89480.1 ribosomal protein S3 [Desmodesmus abundans]